jgi:predicted SnoaL-like aldol condensation-catalyzing enzyme
MSTEQGIAVTFLQMLVAGNIREAYEKYVDSGFRHHNPYYKGDAASLQKGMEENHAEFPTKTIKVQHVLQTGNLIAVHSHVSLRPASPGIAAVHLLRFENEKIVEMWDVAQPIPEESPNENGMF